MKEKENEIVTLAKGARKAVIQFWRSQAQEPVIEDDSGDRHGALARRCPDNVGPFCKSITLFYMDLPPDRI